MMTNNDKSLIQQLIRAGKFWVVEDFMPEYNLLKSKEIIERMGAKWCCHPVNHIKRLDVPLPILTEPKFKVLKRK